MVAYWASIAETTGHEGRYMIAFTMCGEERSKLNSMESRLGEQSSLHLRSVGVKSGKRRIAYLKSGGKLPGKRMRSSSKAAAEPTATPPATLGRGCQDLSRRLKAQAAGTGGRGCGPWVEAVGFAVHQYMESSFPPKTAA